MAFDVEGAKAAGYSEAEIADHLAGEAKFDAAGARKSGYSDQEIISHLSAAPAEQPKPRLGSRPQVPSPELNAAEGRIANAAVEAYRNTPDILTPEARAAVNSTATPLGAIGGAMGRFIVNPLLDIAGAGLAAARGVGAGGAQAVVEGANALGVPAVGRDINMAAQVAPAAAMPGFGGYRMPTIEVKPNALAPKFIGEYFGEKIPGEGALRPPATLEAITDATRRATPETWRPVGPGEDMTPGRTYRANQQTGQREVLESGVPQSPAAAPAETGGSVGAASRDRSANAPVMTPAEAQASRSTGEMQRLMTTPQPGDAREYVPGVKPTKAEIELSPTVSREAKGLRQEFREGFSEKEKADNEVYHDFYDTMAGTPTIVERMDRERGAQAARDLEETWKNKAPADPSPVIQAADEIKASPDWHRTAVRNAVKSVVDELYDGDNLITDPEQLYGVRKHLSDLLSKEGARDNPMAVRATANLMQLRSALDGVIEQAAPGFGQYLKNFQEASRPIDVMERLQKAKTELTNGPDRVITFGKFDRLLKNLVAERADPDATLPAKAIPDDMMERLFDMHRSLARSASDQELAKTRGSDTTQMLGELGRQGLAQVGATMIAPGVGNLAIPFVSKQIHRLFAERKVQQHLNPDITPYRNRLMP